MTTTNLPLIIFIFCLLLGGSILLLKQRSGIVSDEKYKTSNERVLEAEVLRLGNTVQTLLIKLNDAQREIDNLRQQLMEANARITELELHSKSGSSKQKLLRPLLVICGDDVNVAGMDLQVLDKIGIRYIRLNNASTDDVINEIAREQEDRRLCKWILISAHANADGVKLRDKLAPTDFWMRHLGGFDVVALAACQTTNLADHLRDKVDFVWYFKEDVPNEAANRFVQKFFQRLNSGDTAELAFTAGLDAVPEVSAYVDYRSR